MARRAGCRARRRPGRERADRWSSRLRRRRRGAQPGARRAARIPPRVLRLALRRRSVGNLRVARRSCREARRARGGRHHPAHAGSTDAAHRPPPAGRRPRWRRSCAPQPGADAPDGQPRGLALALAHRILAGAIRTTTKSNRGRTKEEPFGRRNHQGAREGRGRDLVRLRPADREERQTGPALQRGGRSGARAGVLAAPARGPAA